MLFPYKEMDLAEFMRSDTPGRWFSDRESYYFAIGRLTSTVEKLYYFNLTEAQLELIGCHRDLRPANILVTKGDFILADFGLLKFKEVKDGSALYY